MPFTKLQEMYFRNSNVRSKIIKLRNEGLTVRQIADVIRMSKSSVHRTLSNKGRRSSFHIA